MIAEAVAPVKPIRATMRANQGFLGTGENGDARFAEVRCVKSIPTGLMHWHIPRDGCDGQNIYLWVPESHDESDGVVGSCVGINQKEAFHAP